MIITDGGRYSSSYPDEHRDCTVRALAVAADLTYNRAHRILQIHGRKRKQGLHTEGKWAIITGSICCRRHGTVRKFVRDFPTGRFIIDVRHHSLAVIDGVIHDLDPDEEITLLGSWVRGAWKVDPADAEVYYGFAMRFAQKKGIKCSV